MGGSQSKSPAKEEKTPAKTSSKENTPAKEVTPAKTESPAKEEKTPAKTCSKENTPAKEVTQVKTESSAAKPTSSTSAAKTPAPETGDTLPDLAALTITTPTKAPAAGGDEPTSPKPQYEVSEEELASVEAVSKTLRDTTGGKSLEIMLSPAVKKPKSRVSPPTSPTSNQETLAKKLQEAEERKQVLEQEK